MLPRHSYSHYGPPDRGGRLAGGLAAAVSDDKIVVAELIPMMSYFSSLPTTMYYHWIHNTVDNSFFYPLKDFDSLFTFLDVFDLLHRFISVKLFSNSKN